MISEVVHQNGLVKCPLSPITAAAFVMMRLKYHLTWYGRMEMAFNSL